MYQCEKCGAIRPSDCKCSTVQTAPERKYGGYTLKQLDNILDQVDAGYPLKDYLDPEQIFAILNDVVIAAKRGW